MGTWQRHRLLEQDGPKQLPESRRSSRMDNWKSSTSEQKSNSLRQSVKFEETAAPSYRTESKSSSSSSHISETLPELFSETKNSDQADIGERHRLVQQDCPKPIPEPRRYSLIDSSKSSMNEQKACTPPKSVKSEVTEASNSPVVTIRTSSKDMAGHVPPKLPDSDAFTAFFQSLKQTRE